MKSTKFLAGLIAALASTSVYAQLTVRAPSAPITLEVTTLYARTSEIVRSGVPAERQVEVARALEAKTTELLQRGGMTEQGFNAEITKELSRLMGDQAAKVEADVIKAGIMTFNPISAYTLPGAADAQVRQCQFRGESTANSVSVVDTAKSIADAQALATETRDLLAQVEATSKQMGPCKAAAGSSACAAFVSSRKALIERAAGGDISLAQGFRVMDQIVAKNSSLGIFEGRRETAKEVCSIVSGKACTGAEAQEYEVCIL